MTEGGKKSQVGNSSAKGKSSNTSPLSMFRQSAPIKKTSKEADKLGNASHIVKQKLLGTPGFKPMNQTEQQPDTQTDSINMRQGSKMNLSLQ